jgi:hypothetical protein
MNSDISPILLNFYEISNASEEKSLVYLYESLVYEQKNPEFCDKFLIDVMKSPLTTNMVVHILNVLSPLKNDIPIWNDFVKMSHQFLIDQEGEENAKKLLKVIL